MGRKKVCRGIDEAEIEIAVQDVSFYKSSLYSETEFNLEVSKAERDLKRRGATKAQITGFKRRVAHLPIMGGKFNE